MITSLLNRVLRGTRRMVYFCLRRADVLLPYRSDKVIIFSYHSIAKDGWRFSIDPGIFREQIEALLDRYQPLSLTEAVEFLCGTRAIRRPSFVLTFDDGYRDVLGVKEFLAEKNIRPALFILSDTKHVDERELGTDRKFLDARDVRSLHDAGWEVGCHSATHGDFWSMSPERISEETVGAKKKLEGEFGFPIRYFAYPRGRYTDIAKKLLREAGYVAAFSMDDGLLSTKTDTFAVPRIGVDRTHSSGEFRALHTDAAILFRSIVKKYIGKFL